MLKRQTSGSVVCPSCGRLVGVMDETCFNCGRRNPGLWGYAQFFNKLGQDFGFTQIVIFGCVALFAATLLADFNGARAGGLMLFSPSTKSLFLFGMSGAGPVLAEGRWWTVLSAAWLHGGVLHILFNMMWIRQLASATAEFYGVGRLVIIYTISSVVGFGLTTIAFILPLPNFLKGAYFTVGASAPLFGLFGALYYYGKRTGNDRIREYGVQFLVIWLVIGVLASGIGIDNWAHLGGFLGGVLAARWLDPLKPEEPIHMVLALICLILTALSIIASIVTALNHPLMLT